MFQRFVHRCTALYSNDGFLHIGYVFDSRMLALKPNMVAKTMAAERVTASSAVRIVDLFALVNC